MIPFSGYSDLFWMLLLYLWGLGLSVFLTLGPLNAGAVLFISVGGVCGTAFVPLLNLFRTRWKGQGALGLRATRISRLFGVCKVSEIPETSLCSSLRTSALYFLHVFLWYIREMREAK